MPKHIDLTNQKFGRWTVISLADKHPRAWYLCKCDCGFESIVSAAGLSSGVSKSCGCLHKDIVRKMKTKHGHAPTIGRPQSRTYASWRGMKLRCQNPNHAKYDCYGGRGIKICERWQHFENFLADMGEKSDGQELERKDNLGNYEPGNVVWATHSINNRNRRDNNVLEFDGQKLCIAEWAEKTGLGWHTIYYRIKRGWSIQRALGY